MAAQKLVYSYRETEFWKNPQRLGDFVGYFYLTYYLIAQVISACMWSISTCACHNTNDDIMHRLITISVILCCIYACVYVCME